MLPDAMWLLSTQNLSYRQHAYVIYHVIKFCLPVYEQIRHQVQQPIVSAARCHWRPVNNRLV